MSKVYVFGEHARKGWSLLHVALRKNTPTIPDGVFPPDDIFPPDEGVSYALIELPGHPTPGVYSIEDLPGLVGEGSAENQST